MSMGVTSQEERRLMMSGESRADELVEELKLKWVEGGDVEQI